MKGKGRRPKSEDGKKAEIRGANADGTLRLSWAIMGCLGWLCVTGTMLAAEPNGASELPASSLRPPRGEIPPTFWEQHGGWIIAGSILALTIVAAGVWLLMRPKPEQPEPSVVAARRELRSLADKPEDALLLVKTSRILRRYVTSAFSLPGVEMNTREFCDAMSGNSELGAALAREISEFLQRCDVKKFAPAPPKASLGAVATATGIIEQAEQRLTQIQQSAAAAARAVSSSHDSGKTQGASGPGLN